MKNKRGFTLIEVLIALVIISIAFTAIVISSARSIRNTRYLEDKIMARWVGSYVTNQIQVGLLKLAGNDALHLSTEMFNQVWFWNASLQSTPQPRIKKVIVSVSSREKGDNLVQIVSYIPIALQDARF